LERLGVWLAFSAAGGGMIFVGFNPPDPHWPPIVVGALLVFGVLLGGIGLVGFWLEAASFIYRKMGGGASTVPTPVEEAQTPALKIRGPGGSSLVIPGPHSPKERIAAIQSFEKISQ
jgi:hypothetical protein